MKERLLYNWTFTRGLYLAMGVLVTIQSVLNEQWVGLAFGLYLASMGIFALGCAAGNCIGGSCATEPSQPSKSAIEYTEQDKLK